MKNFVYLEQQTRTKKLDLDPFSVPPIEASPHPIVALPHPPPVLGIFFLSSSACPHFPEARFLFRFQPKKAQTGEGFSTTGGDSLDFRGLWPVKVALSSFFAFSTFSLAEGFSAAGPLSFSSLQPPSCIRHFSFAIIIGNTIYPV
ncbi:hypothetical protein DTO046C5_1001 [Penicillium roqueforti]|nr:hypothetical protein DTO046C5_1001 [Penicillium roqueforti]